MCMCLKCLSNTCPFFDQSNSDMPFINFGFSGFCFSSDTSIFEDKSLKSVFKKCSSLEIAFNNSDHLVCIDSKYHDINNFGKVNVNKNPSLATIHLNIALLSKHFKDL